MHSCVENRSHILPNWSRNAGGGNIRTCSELHTPHCWTPAKLIPNTKMYCRMATHVFCHYWQWIVIQCMEQLLVCLKMSDFMAIISMDATGLLEEKLHTHSLFACILNVALTVLRYGNVPSWHTTAWMDELYFFFSGSVESYNSFVHNRPECRLMHLPITANELRCTLLCEYT
jgi:uncharacterized membrane protein